MRDNVSCEFPAGYEGTVILERLAHVLDPELDEPILDLGFVRSLQLRCGHASVALRLGEVSMQGDPTVIWRPGSPPVESGSAAVLQRYLARRAELALDCSLAAPLIVDLEGKPFSVEQLQAHYEAIRTVRVALEANGSFCRALLSVHCPDAAEPSGHADPGGRHVQS